MSEGSLVRRFVGSIRRNAVAFAALMVALGGTAVATHEAIDSSDVIDNSLTSADIRDYDPQAVVPPCGPEIPPGGCPPPDPGGLAGDDIRADSLSGSHIINGSVTSSDVRDVQILNDEFVGGLQSQDIGHSQITAAQIASAAVGTAELALGAVTGAKIADESITGEKIRPGDIGAIELGESSVGSSELVNDGVTGSDIKNEGINAIDLNAGSVTSSRIADGNVESSDLADGGVSTADYANNSVTASKLAAGAINGKTMVPTVVTATTQKKKFGDGYFCKNKDVGGQACQRVGVATCPQGMVAIEGGTYATNLNTVKGNDSTPVRVGGPVPRGFKPQKDGASVPGSFTPEAWWATFYSDKAGKVYAVCI